MPLQHIQSDKHAAQFWKIDWKIDYVLKIYLFWTAKAKSEDFVGSEENHSHTHTHAILCNLAQK